MSNLLKSWKLLVRRERFSQTIWHCFGALLISLLLSCSSQATKLAQPDHESAQGISTSSVGRISETEQGERGDLSEQGSLQVEPIEPPASELSARPAILLDRSYTLQIGIYDRREEANSIVAKHQLNAEEAGIAIVTIEGSQKYLLAYGIYGDKSTAQIEAQKIETQIEAAVEIVLLEEIEAMSEIVDKAPAVRAF